MPEILDIINIDDQVIGQATHDKIHPELTFLWEKLY